MSAAQIERIQEHLQRLRLFKSRERLEALLQDASTRELSYAEFLDQVLTEEVTAKTAKHVTMRTSLARFPFVTFEFGYQPSLDRKQVQTLATCRFIEHGENVVLLGPPGVGKTHCETQGVAGWLRWRGVTQKLIGGAACACPRSGSVRLTIGQPGHHPLA